MSTTDSLAFLALCARARGHAGQYARLTSAPPPSDWGHTLASLPAVKKTVDGQQVTVEVHHQLFASQARLGSTTYDDLAPAAQLFDLHGVAAYTPGKEAMLWHVYAHAFRVPLTYEPLRLIWIADLVSLVEAWLDEIDWDVVQRRYRRAFNALPMLHHLTPWPEAVLDRLALDVRHAPTGVGQTFEGWPRSEKRGCGARCATRSGRRNGGCACATASETGLPGCGIGGPGTYCTSCARCRPICARTPHIVRGGLYAGCSTGDEAGLSGALVVWGKHRGDWYFGIFWLGPSCLKSQM